MKLTNFSVSKDLHLADFKPEFGDWRDCYWRKFYGENPELISNRILSPRNEILCKAYDLETLLSFLPWKLEDHYSPEDDSYSQMELTITETDIFYTNGYEFINVGHAGEDNCLADTAGRLLLLLDEKKIINLQEIK
jgi:hypothetical protein